MKKLKIPTSWLIGFIIIVLATMLEYLDIAQSLQILFMYTLVLLTAHYAMSTQKMAERMEAESATRRPYLNFDNWHLPDPANQKLWRCNLKNFGTTPAYAVQLDMEPRVSGYLGTLPVQITAGSPIIMPGQWNQHTIDLGSTLQVASSQQARLEVEFVIRYRSASRKPSKTWELRLVRTPDPIISNNWLFVGEDSETELVTNA